MEDKEKIAALIENYKVISEETKSYLSEMIRCFLYAAIVLAIGFGYGKAVDGKVDELIKYMPLAFIGLFVYFFSLGFMYVNASRYKAQIEKKINDIANDTLFGFELLYKPELLKTGFLPIGKNNSRVLPVPNFFLGIIVFAAFVYLVWDKPQTQFWLYVVVGGFFCLLALYVFLLIPRIIEKYQKRKTWI